MALTLLEAAKRGTGNVYHDSVIRAFAGTTDLMAVMPWKTINGMSYTYTQDAVLPGIGFRGYNEGYPEGVGIWNPQTEVLRLLGKDMDFDKKLLKHYGEEARAEHEASLIDAMGLYLTKKFVKGDATADPKEFDGLQNRIVGPQLIEAGSTNGGDPLTFFKLTEAIDAVEKPTHLLMNKVMRARLEEAARDPSIGGHITYALNELGARVMFFHGLPILIADYDETGARYLDFDEVGSGGATATATSIYVLSLGVNKILGLQDGTPMVEDLGEIDAKPVVRSRLDWAVGFATMHPRCASRLRGISNAAITG